MQAHIAQLLAFDRGERFGHAVDERLDADEAGAGQVLRLRDHRFASAESDLERNLGHRIWKQGPQVSRCWLRQIDGKPRQQRVDQLRLMRAQLVAFAPPKEGAGFVELRLVGLWIHNRHFPARRCHSRLSFPAIAKTRMAGTSLRLCRPLREFCRSCQRNALLIAEARSVFSQEKPPSLSGARPKWP